MMRMILCSSIILYCQACIRLSLRLKKLQQRFVCNNNIILYVCFISTTPSLFLFFLFFIFHFVLFLIFFIFYFFIFYFYFYFYFYFIFLFFIF